MDFSTNIDNIRKQIQSKVHPVYMFDEQKVIDEEKDTEEAKQLEEDILAKGHIDEELVLQVVEEMIVEKEENEDEQKLLMKIAEDIYKETME